MTSEVTGEAELRVDPGVVLVPGGRSALHNALDGSPGVPAVAARVIPPGIGDRGAVLRRSPGPAVTIDAAAAFDAGRGFDESGAPIRLAPVDGSDAPASPGRSFLSVVVRTRGDRPTNLAEALTCLAAQRAGDLEVVVVANGCDAGPIEAVTRELPGGFAERVRVVETDPVDRAAALNVGLDAASGEYVGFLDDDDLVTSDWVAAFRSVAGDSPAVLRSGSVTVPVRRTDDAYELTGDPFPEFGGPDFDLVDHLVDNRSPIFSWVAPLDEVRQRGLRFDEDLPVLEDWELLVRCALAFPVLSTGRVTGIYHRWVGGESSLDASGPELWSSTRAELHRRFDHLLGERGIVAALADLERRLGEHGAEVDRLRARLEGRSGHPTPAPRRGRWRRLLGRRVGETG